jgi:hypothetical protein
MEEVLGRAWNDLVGRLDGPMHFRLVVQPVVATFLAIGAGWADARGGRAIHFWTLAREPEKTGVALRNLWRIAGRIFVVAVVLDIFYQLAVLRWIYPLETLIVATMLALVPCMVVRACGNRIVAMARTRRLRREQESLAGSLERQE